MKKLLITLFIILYCANSALAEVVIEHKNKDSFTPKEYTLSKQQEKEANQTNDEKVAAEEEEELNIDWNKWHADVRNKVSHSWHIIIESHYFDYLLEFSAYVDANKNISDIAVVYVPWGSVDLSNATIRFNEDAYIYYYSKNKFYKLTAVSYTIWLGKDGRVLNQMNKFKVSDIDEKDVPNNDFIKHYAQAVNDLNGDSVLTYPKGTKRTKVKVQMSCFPMRWASFSNNWYGHTGDFNPTHFNDIEKQKNKKE